MTDVQAQRLRANSVASDLEGRIAAELRASRERLGWSLAELAERSGVSKAMISRIESGDANPTAVLLGRLCAGLGLTLSALIASAEAVEVATWPAAEQPLLLERSVGMERRTVAVPLASGGFDITRVRLPAGTEIAYDQPPRVAFHQYIVVLSGDLEFTLGEASYQLAAGDSLGAWLDRTTRFRVPASGPVEYLVVAERRAS